MSSCKRGHIEYTVKFSRTNFLLVKLSHMLKHGGSGKSNFASVKTFLNFLNSFQNNLRVKFFRDWKNVLNSFSKTLVNILVLVFAVRVIELVNFQDLPVFTIRLQELVNSQFVTTTQ